MSHTPQEILQDALTKAQSESLSQVLTQVSDDSLQHLKLIVENAESLKAVLGVTLTSIVYKIYRPAQDIRFHQENMPNGYSGRTFDTKFITPFLQNHFPHFAMAESSWLTRSLEQPFPYLLNYGGKIRNRQLKNAFLHLLDSLQNEGRIANELLVTLFALMVEKSAAHESLFTINKVLGTLNVSTVVEAVGQHILHRYPTSGTARLPVLATYAVYKLLVKDVKRYEGKQLAPLEFHTSPDSRSHALGDIEIFDENGICFEVVEIKHRKPITAGMINSVYRKIKDQPINRYYLLTTNEPNVDNLVEVNEKIVQIRQNHSCQIIINGVLPSLKYYLRLVSEPESFIDLYTQLLENEFKRGGGVKSEHLKVWSDIRKRLL